MNRERAAGSALVGLIGLLLALSAVAVISNWDALRPRVSGDPAPLFALPTIAGNGALGPPLAIEELAGSVVLIDFWATWCGPCRQTMPALEAIAQTFADEDFVFLSINTEGVAKAGDARAMANRLSPSAALVSDNGRVADVYGASTIPHLVLVNREGKIAWVHTGAMSRRDTRNLESEVERLLR